MYEPELEKYLRAQIANGRPIQLEDFLAQGGCCNAMSDVARGHPLRKLQPAPTLDPLPVYPKKRTSTRRAQHMMSSAYIGRHARFKIRYGVNHD
jgi:hypothetical protein